MLRTRESTDIFNIFDELYLVFTSKKVNVLYDSVQYAKIIARLLQSKVNGDLFRRSCGDKNTTAVHKHIELKYGHNMCII